MTLQIKNGILTATARSNGLLPRPTKPEIQTEVYLEAMVAQNDFTCFGLQHTGSTGPSATMIHNVELEWK